MPIGAYQLIRELPPTAGFGRRASLVADADDRRFVLKRYTERGLQRGRVVRELASSKQIRHDALARVVEAFEQGSDLVVVLRYTDGVQLEHLLAHMIKRGERIPLEAIWFVAASIAGGMAMVHDAKMVHGHFGPDRVRLGWQGGVQIYGAGTPTLFDKDDRSQLASTYRSPEQRKGGRPAATSDVYSVALTIWTMLTMSYPAADPSARESVTILKQVPPDIARALDNALATRAIRRTATCATLGEVIDKHGTLDQGALQKVLTNYANVDFSRVHTPLPPAPLTEDSTMQRLSDLFDALEVSSGEVTQRDSETDEGWLVEAVKKTTPAALLDKVSTKKRNKPPSEPAQAEPDDEPAQLDEDRRQAVPPPLPQPGGRVRGRAGCDFRPARGGDFGDTLGVGIRLAQGHRLLASGTHRRSANLSRRHTGARRRTDHRRQGRRTDHGRQGRRPDHRP